MTPHGPAARVALAVALALVVALALAACSNTPNPSDVAPPAAIAPLEPVALPGGIGVPTVTLTEAVVPRVGATPDGPALVGGNVAGGLEAGSRAAILGPPRDGPGGTTWVRAWIGQSLTSGPSDFFAWLPTTVAGRPLFGPDPLQTCPATATIASLVRLAPHNRVACAGTTEITIDARAGILPLVPGYDVDPIWFGRNRDSITSLFDPGAVAVGPGATTSPEQAGAWMDAWVAPGVPALPLGLALRVTGHFDDPAAAECTRRVANGLEAVGFPVEAVADSVQWCRGQFVVSSWQVLLGGEGRPLDPARPQLHRREFVPPPGAQFACGGVGMGPLTIRIDPSAGDPVWVESGGRRSLAVFGNEFAVALDPPRIVSSTGLVIANGEILDPDRGKPGLGICPGGDTIWFEVSAR